MHTDDTLDILDKETTALGKQLRAFQSETCSAYSTYELKREMDARKRRQAKKEPKVSSSTTAGGDQKNTNQRKRKVFSLQTYKAHSSGDYVTTIQTVGTTDSYTSQIVGFKLLLLFIDEYILFTGRTGASKT
jgi:hypothetical protein